MKRPRFDDITANPVAVVLEELPRERKDRPDCATWENGKQIIHAMPDPRNKTAAIIMAKTGARVSEVLALEMDDLQLEEGFIRFQNRKGGRATVNPIDEETVHAIERFQFVRQPESEYLFTSIRGNRVSREQVRRAVRATAVDADIMDEGEHRFHKKFTPHTYRTVFTTLMRYEGMLEFMIRYLRGDADDGEIDLYTKMDQTTIRDQYLNCMKTLDL